MVQETSASGKVPVTPACIKTLSHYKVKSFQQDNYYQLPLLQKKKSKPHYPLKHEDSTNFSQLKSNNYNKIQKSTTTQNKVAVNNCTIGNALDQVS